MKKYTMLIISSTVLSLLATTFGPVANAHQLQSSTKFQLTALQSEPQNNRSIISPVVDNDGVYHFEANAGDILVVTVKQEKTPYTRTCYPTFFADPRISLREASLPTYEPDTVKGLLEIHEDGEYSYSIAYSLVSLADLGLGANNADNTTEDGAELTDCTITVELAKDYDLLWVRAYQLGKQPERRTEALNLYRQTVEAEPPYPLPYLGYLALLMRDYGEQRNIDINDLSATGPMFMDMPEAQRQSILQSLEQLVRIFEANPGWQEDPWTNPDFLRVYADHVKTGRVSDTIQTPFPWWSSD
ncbi:MAG: hypothetical protein AAF821_17750 [Cyanobacteria bacterium P01_D01_bin.156]